MKYLRTILIWTIPFLIFGFSLKYFLDITDNVIAFIIGGMGLIIGFVKAILIKFSSSSKTEMFSQARKMFNGKINLNGETELLINERKIILDYKLEDLGSRMTEYIIAKIDLTNIPREKIKNLKEKYEIIESNNRFYEIVYCSWGNNGIDFKNIIENKLIQIDNLIDKKR